MEKELFLLCLINLRRQNWWIFCYNLVWTFPLQIGVEQIRIERERARGIYKLWQTFLSALPRALSLSLAVQFSSVAQSYPTPCDPMNCSTPGLPVHHQHPEFTQTRIHRVSDAIQPSHPLSSPSPPAPNPSQHHSLFQWVSFIYSNWKARWWFVFCLLRVSRDAA